ncbi:MAG: YjhG/YagF family D-xylonate dehydratase [Chloroflexi bacterium]|nr:YjhG/YagF family D-xylonate dehydratase [Chloroflexota bacterium]
MHHIPKPSLEEIFGSADSIRGTRTEAEGPQGRLPLTGEMLLNEPSGNLFGLTQNAGMGWDPREVNHPAYLILSTMGGLRGEDGAPVALGMHTGHWELGLLVREAAETLRSQGALPFAVYCSDPCDGRTQGTPGMLDSLAYRNDAAVVMRRLIRSLPVRQGVLGIASCDKGLPATMMALAGEKQLPGVVIPGGVTLPARGAEDAGKIQSIGARYAHGLVTLDYAAEMGCRACGSSGGGCQFLGTAATSQVVAEALGMALTHSALAPSGEPVWQDMARRSALAVLRQKAAGLSMEDILTPAAIENAMIVHAAFGGSTNLLLHIPAVAHAAGLKRPVVDDWIRVNRAVPRLVDVLPNGPRGFATVYAFMAGGVPEVMLHLRDLGLLNLNALTASGETLGAALDWWEGSERRQAARQTLREAGIDPDLVILSPDAARREGLTSTLVFPVGNLAPQGSVIKATAIDPSVVGEDDVYRCRGRARVFTSEHEAIRAIKGQDQPLQPGDVLVYIGGGPLGTGMEETYELTAALKHLPWGKHVPLITDARFSGVSTGACIGHIGPEALAGGPIGRLRDGDLIEIVIDRANLVGRVDLVGTGEGELTPEEAADLLAARQPHPNLRPRPDLPDDTRLWAALQAVSGGTWGGAVYDVDAILQALERGSRGATP